MLRLGLFRRHRQWILIALLCLMLWGAPIDGLYAQPQAQTLGLEAKPSQGLASSIWGILAAIVAGITGLALLFWRRSPVSKHTPDTSGMIDPPAQVRLMPAASPRAVRPQASAAVAAHAPQDQQTERPLFNTSGHGDQKVCLSCRRMYAHWVVVCPVDATPLSPTLLATRDPKHTRIERMRCSTCARRYTVGAVHCGHDGDTLKHDTLRHAARAPDVEVCTHCGQESPQATCCGAPAHRTLRPDDMTPPHPMVAALWCCPKCAHVGAPGQTVCAHDDTPLVPMEAVVRHALPHVGFGPKRRVCTQCANMFGSGFAFCTFDGTPLIDVH